MMLIDYLQPWAFNFFDNCPAVFGLVLCNLDTHIPICGWLVPQLLALFGIVLYYYHILLPMFIARNAQFQYHRTTCIYLHLPTSTDMCLLLPTSSAYIYLQPITHLWALFPQHVVKRARGERLPKFVGVTGASKQKPRGASVREDHSDLTVACVAYGKTTQGWSTNG